MKRIIAIPAFLILFQLDSFSQSTDSTAKITRFTRPQLYAPAALILSGFIANGHSVESIKNEVAEERNEHIPGFKTKIDDYLQFSPLAITYGLDAFGVKSKTDFLNRSVILLKGEVLAIGTATVLKKHFIHYGPTEVHTHLFHRVIPHKHLLRQPS